jgi:hypothetical protein
MVPKPLGMIVACTMALVLNHYLNPPLWFCIVLGTLAGFCGAYIESSKWIGEE